MTCGGFKKVGFASMAILSIFGIGFLSNPLFFNSDAYAANKLDVKVRIVPQLSLTTSTDTVSMNVIPEPAGSFTSNDVTATVSTNNATGYSLIMSTKGNDANLVNTVDNTKYLTSTFSGSVTSANMTQNTWGYSLDATNFSAVPLAEDAVEINSSDAAKVGPEIVSGTYEDIVVFTAIANSDIVPEEEYTIYDITYMQGMTSLICQNTTTPSENATETIWNLSDDDNYIPRTSLIDKRDGTSYIISKLPDGTCWMSENLEFELDNEALDNVDTDLNTIDSWTPNNQTYDWETENITWAGNSWDTDKSIKAPVDTKFLINGTTPAATQSNSVTSNRWERVGVYYNWRAATAGLSTQSSTGEASQNSICPKGWTLPSSEQIGYIISHITRANSVEPPFNFIYSGSVTSGYGGNNSPSSFGGDTGEITFWSSDDGKGFRYSYSWGGAGVETYYKDVALAVRCVAR
jgi:uncharacterized protein (TIGR02145 family)